MWTETLPSRGLQNVNVSRFDLYRQNEKNKQTKMTEKNDSAQVFRSLHEMNLPACELQNTCAESFFSVI